MSSVGSRVNGSTVSIPGVSVFDVIGSECVTGAVRSMTMELRSDLTIYAMSVVFANRGVHRVNLLTKRTRGCSVSGNVTLSSNGTVNSSRLSIGATGKLEIDETIDVSETVTAGCLTGSSVGLIRMR